MMLNFIELLTTFLDVCSFVDNIGILLRIIYEIRISFMTFFVTFDGYTLESFFVWPPDLQRYYMQIHTSTLLLNNMNLRYY